MILDRNIPYDLTLGDERRTPEMDDAQLRVPATIIPAVLSLRPHTINPNSAVPQEQSFFAQASQAQPPSTGITQTIVFTITSGLWELGIWMTSWFDYLGAVASFNNNAIVLTYQNNNIPVITRRSQVGGFTDYLTMRVLLRSVVQIRLSSPATLAAQNSEITLNLNAIRVL